MNFFGHAVVASWTSPGGGHALGAMLPDFQTMCGARVAAVGDPAIAAGIELHHRTDAAFHRLPAFVGLTRAVEQRLADGGVSRGPMRAVGHVGVELLLDGALLDDAGGRAAYTAALAHPITSLTWRDPGDGDRFATLHARLIAHGIPDDLARPESASARVLRMIAHRPLLRATAAEAEVIRRELAAIAPRVHAAAPTIVEALRTALDLDERRRLGHDRWDEVWEGVLHMVPPPSSIHQRLGTRLVQVLGPLASQRGLELTYETGVYRPGSAGNDYRVPDLVIADPKQVSHRGVEGRAELVIEILSPDDESREKLPFYAEMGIPEVWLLEPATRIVEVYVLRGGGYHAVVAGDDGAVRAPLLAVELTTIAGPRLRVHWASGDAEI